MRVVRVSAKAAQELEEAAAWYTKQRPGLGASLIDAFEHAIDLLREDFPPLTPLAGEASNFGAKRLLLHRFPFSVITIEQDGDFVVVALAHHARRPGYWKGRLVT